MSAATVCCPAESFILFQWASQFSGWVAYTVLGLFPLSSEGRIVNYFILQLLKSSLILFPVIYLASLIRFGLNPRKVWLFLEGKSRWFGYLFGSLLGMITPFCSCAAVPLFVGFAAAGIRKGVAISFLVTAPLVSESGIVLIAGTMGMEYAVITTLAGGVLGILAGVLFDWIESRGKSLFLTVDSDISERWNGSGNHSFGARNRFAMNELQKISIKLFPWLVVALVAASFMRALVPADMIGATLADDHWWSVILAVLAGIPIYGTVGSIAPVGAVLLEKGAAPGTVLAFMMSVSGASIPEFILLKQVVTARGLLILFTVFLVGFCVVGFVVNALY